MMERFRNDVFRKDGVGYNIMTRKIKDAKAAEVHRIESETLKDCNVMFKDGLQRANGMQGQDKVDFLRKLQRALLDRGVNSTYNPKAEEQSYVHRHIEDMAFRVAKEIVITQEKLKKR